MGAEGSHPLSHETLKMKSMTNAGAAMAAGLVAGAWNSQPGVSNAVAGECGLSRTRSTSWREPG